MADPQRLLNDPDASPLARSLLASAEEDAPSSRQRAAVAKRLGIAAGLLAGTSEVGAGAVAGAGALWWKIGIVIAVLGGAITGGVALLRDAAPAAEVAATAPAPARATARAMAQAPARATVEPPRAMEPPAPVIEAAPAPAAPPAAEPAPAPAPSTPAPAPSTPAPAPSTPAPIFAKPAPPAKAKAKAIAPPAPEPAPAPAPPPPPAAPVDARRLAAEVAVLDRARAALRRGDTAVATAALDEHARDFADGALVAEAEVVRIEALVHAGQADAARERARAFLARFPQSPLAKRLRSIALRLPTPAKESP